MPTTLGFKDIIDLAEFRPCAPLLLSLTSGAGFSCDLRNNEDRCPNLYLLTSNSTFSKYSVKNDEWISLVSPALSGTFNAGAGSIFVPSSGPYGTIAAGATNTTITLTTALPAAVGVNQLANRGDGIGFKIRIIGNSAGSSGTIEEKTIVANTAGTNPLIELDSALGFVPAVGDGYEFLSGKIFLFGAGALAAGIFKSYDIATQSLATLTTTNLIATIATDMTIFAMDESYVPYNHVPYSGFVWSGATQYLTSTASGAASLTGQAALGDATVLANEYRNFQIRIIEDIAIPTAVGQRRKITTHTAGASPIYTVAAWAVQPSAVCKYVIEYNNDILVWNGVTTVTYSYLAGYNADANWSTAAALGGATQYANPPAAHAASAMVLPSFGLTPDTAKNARHSFFYYFRGGNTNTLDLFDIAGGATGLWTANINYANNNSLFTTGSSSIYDGSTISGKYGYISSSSNQRFLRFDVKNRVLEPFAYLKYTGGSNSIYQKLALSLFVDGTTKLSNLYVIPSTGLSSFFNIFIQR